MSPDRQHISLVVSPLRNLIRDQAKQWESKGIRCVGIIGGEEISENAILGWL